MLRHRNDIIGSLLGPWVVINPFLGAGWPGGLLHVLSLSLSLVMRINNAIWC
jgi:hypothetical protein